MAINPADEIDEIIDSILKYPQERINIEFKPSVKWTLDSNDIPDYDKCVETIKTILAMSNNRDGGIIILGIRKNNTGTYTFEGIKDEYLKSYDSDIIYDQIRNFGRPEPKFDVLKKIHSNKPFVVFKVYPSERIPIICNNPKNNHQGLTHLAIYIRTYKPETKKIDKPEELEELIESFVDRHLTKISGRSERILEDLIKKYVAKDKAYKDIILQRQQEKSYDIQEQKIKFQNEIKDIKDIRP
jgi:hypothetical protein